MGPINLFMFIPRSSDLKLLLVGDNLHIVGGSSKSESHGIPIAYCDLLQIYLYAAVLAGNIATVAAFARTRTTF